jgi:hypothetical protein
VPANKPRAQILSGRARSKDNGARRGSESGAPVVRRFRSRGGSRGAGAAETSDAGATISGMLADRQEGRTLNYARRQQLRRLSRCGQAAAGSVATGLLGLLILSAGAALIGSLLLAAAVGLGLYARHWLELAGRARVGARSEDEVQCALASLKAEGWRLRHSLSWQGRGDIDPWRSPPPGSALSSRRNAPRGALLYPRLSREELEGWFLGPMAYPDLKGERDNSMPLKRWSAEASGLGCRGTRVIWRKLDCLNPNLQTMQRSVCRKDACDRHHALRRLSSSVVATFGVWSVAQ